MIKLFILFIQLALLVFFASVIVNYSYPIAITFNEIILSTSTSIIIFLIIAIIFLLLFIQRIIFLSNKDFFDLNLIDKKVIMKKDIMHLHKA